MKGAIFMKMFGKKRRMANEDKNAVKRFSAYQKKADKMINHRVMHAHNRRG